MPIIIPAALAAISSKIGAKAAIAGIAKNGPTKVGGFLRGVVSGNTARKIANTANDVKSVADEVAQRKSNPVYDDRLQTPVRINERDAGLVDDVSKIGNTILYVIGGLIVFTLISRRR